MDDFVTTNFGTRAPRTRAPLEQNSSDATTLSPSARVPECQKSKSLAIDLDGKV